MPFLVQRHVGQDVDRHLFAICVDGHGVVDGLRQRRVRIPAGKYGAERALRATASVGSRFTLFFDYYDNIFYYKLCIINHSFYLSHKIYLVFYV